MAIRRILLLVFVYRLFVGCIHQCPLSRSYLDGGSAVVNPQKDSLTIGDSLFIDITIPKSYTTNTGLVDLSGASNVVTQINFNAIPKQDTITGAVDSFTFINGKGTFFPNPQIPHDALNIIFTEEASSYTFSLVFVTKKKGLYVIVPLDIYQAEKKCLKASIKIQMTGNQHLAFLSLIYHPGSPYEPTIPDVDQLHDYCFKVY